MALHSETKVYKATYDLLKNLLRTIEKLPRNYKFSIGQILTEALTEVMQYIYMANTHVDRVDYIANAQMKLEIIRLYIRLLNELKQISIGKFIELHEQLELVSKQLVAWKKYSKNKN